MQLQSVPVHGVLMALIVLMAFSTPAAADDMSPWGVWSDGARLKPSKRSTETSPSMLPPSYAGFGGLAPAEQPSRKVVELADGGRRPEISPDAPPVVAFHADGFEPGSVVIDTAGRKLYYVLSDSEAYQYPVAVGKEGFTWTGTETVSKVVDWPDWIPPKEMRARKPGLPLRMTGGLRNPLGARAIYLGQSLYRIHGTNEPSSIGTAASSGCIRMLNEHVVHLVSLVDGQTVVHVVKRLPRDVLMARPAPDAPEAPAAEQPDDTASRQI